MGTRSNRLAAHSFTIVTNLVVYTVPTAVRTLVKNIIVSNLSSTAAAMEIKYNTTSANVTPVSFQPLAAGSTHIIPTWDVLLEGDTIEVFSLTAPFDVWISGAELTGP